jgi:hypothetical protein
MAEWRPDRTVQVRASGRVHTLHLFIVPARVDGAWALEVTGPAGPWRATVAFAQRFQELDGTLRAETGETLALRGDLRGDAIAFTVADPATSVARRFRGRVDVDGTGPARGAAGTVEVTGGPAPGDYRWIARRPG